MIDEPIAAEVLAVPTISNILAEAGLAIKRLRKEPAWFESEQPIMVPLASEMIVPSVKMGREDDQLVLPREIVESTVPLTMAIADNPISKEPIQQKLTRMNGTR